MSHLAGFLSFYTALIPKQLFPEWQDANEVSEGKPKGMQM